MTQNNGMSRHSLGGEVIFFFAALYCFLFELNALFVLLTWNYCLLANLRYEGGKKGIQFKEGATKCCYENKFDVRMGPHHTLHAHTHSSLETQIVSRLLNSPTDTTYHVSTQFQLTTRSVLAKPKLDWSYLCYKKALIRVPRRSYQLLLLSCFHGLVKRQIVLKPHLMFKLLGSQYAALEGMPFYIAYFTI